MAILNIILKTVKPDQRIFLSIYRDFNFLFFETGDHFPSQLHFFFFSKKGRDFKYNGSHATDTSTRLERITSNCL